MPTAEHLNRLLELYKIADNYGFSWPSISFILNQVHSECTEVSEAIVQGESEQRIQEETADLLHAVCVLCFFKGYNVDALLKQSIDKFERRFVLVKEVAEAQGYVDLKTLSYEAKMTLWSAAKVLEKKQMSDLLKTDSQ